MTGTIRLPLGPFDLESPTRHRTSPLAYGSFHREEDRYLSDIGSLDLHLSEPEVHAIESFNSDLSFISHLDPNALIPVVGKRALTMAMNENRSDKK